MQKLLKLERRKNCEKDKFYIFIFREKKSVFSIENADFFIIFY